MKYYLLVILLAIAVTSCNQDKKPSKLPENAINPDVMKNPASAVGNAEKSKLPSFQFDEVTHDFGAINGGDIVSYSFKFKNIGKADLVISSATGSCGCTVPEYPKDPIPAGGSGVIKVTFDSNGKEGHQEKTVTLIANTIPNSKILTITATVDLPKDK
jgi:hypothetical protein